MTAVVLAGVCGYGVFLLYTGVTCGWRGVGMGPVVSRPRIDLRFAALAPFGLTALAAGVVAYVLFGGVVAPAFAALCGCAAPTAGARAERRRQRAQFAGAWPRLIEEVRLQTSSLGRSIPVALFDASRNAPAELRVAFAPAERVWLVTADFAQTVATLKRDLSDAGADAALEVLLVAHEVGGTELGRRLRALADDRTQDVRDREDARAKQAGVRFARRFVLLVPAGMALAGLSIGSGRDAYGSPLGQLAVATGIALVTACWVWAGHLMRLPETPRVFGDRG